VPPAPPAPKPQEPFSLSFSLGVVDDYDINRSTINSRQQEKFDMIVQQIHGFMETCPASIVYITGYTDKPGTEPDNFDLGLDRAAYAKTQLLWELRDIEFTGLGPAIFALSEGENKPVEETEENVYSAKNRRIEFEFHSICPPLGTSSNSSPTFNFFE
jgi:outer membrane protein OmpA-like peptidoglycan-associated protein